MDQGKIGTFISDLRRQKHMTQAELGDIVGVTGKAVSRWERGLNLPDRAIMNKVSEALGVTTTELLNGERVVDLSNIDLDAITEKSVAYYKAKLKKKFKKILYVLISTIVVLALIIFMIFYFNNSGSCTVYSIDSDSTELDAQGIITQTNDKTTLVISNFEYYGTNIKNVYSINYDLIIDEQIIHTGGYKFDEINYDKKEVDIKNFFRIITIYVDNLNYYDFNNSKYVEIKFRYIDKDSQLFEFRLPLKIEKKFTNNKFIYF